MALNDLTGQNIQDTYQKVVQTDGVKLADGTGSLLPISFDGNDVIIPGALKAQSYIVSESIVNVSSGSTIFGDSTDDTHTFIGSITAPFLTAVNGSISSVSIGTTRHIAAGTYINAGSHITASGNISSSGEFIGASALITNITASGNISASGTGLFTDLMVQDQVIRKANGVLNVPGPGFTATQITASGNISASGVITATQGFGTIDGGTF